MMHKIINQLSLDDIVSFMANGKLDNAPEGVPEYLNLLDKIRGMLIRFDKYPNDEVIVKHLVIVDQLTRAKARIVIAEAREYFWVDKIVSKDAWIGIYAEKMDKVANLSALAIKDVRDGALVLKMYKEIFEVRTSNMDEGNEIAYELINQPRFTIYTMNPEDLGLPKANRNNIKALIESKTLELSDKEKNQIFREADILPFEIFPNEQKNARKT